MSTLRTVLGAGIKSIQRGTITGATTATVTAVDTAKSVLHNLGMTNSAGDANTLAKLVLTNSTTITQTQTAAGGNAITSYELVEYY